MTGRELHKEWIGKTPNSRVPWRVEERLLEAASNKCQGPCHQSIGPGNPYDIDHIIELKDWLGEGHGNRESNLQLLCRKVCHKTKSRIAKIARANCSRTRKHLNGKRRPRHIIPGSKLSKLARRYNRTTGKFETVLR